jgi:DNA polymerase III subunit delta'
MTTFPLTPYPWQLHDWQQLTQLLNLHKLPHAVIFTGAKGIGKQHLAAAFVQLVLCASPVVDAEKSLIPCKQCRNCQLNAAQTHPDLFWLLPEEEGKAIKIDQVRELNAALAQTANQGGYKCVIIDPADAMNTNAANALLKTLEEPAAKTLMILITNQLSRVIPTIRSRCRQIKLTSPSPEQMQIDEDQLAKWKKFSTQMMELSLGKTSAIALASDWHTDNVATLLDNWLTIIYRVSVLHADAESVNHEFLMQGDLPEWRKLSQQINVVYLHKYYEKLLLIKQQLLSGANPNKQLLLEEVFMDWQVLIKMKRVAA